MDRIRKAIEQAGRERAAHGLTDASAEPAAASRTGEAARGTADFTGRFPYRQTKVVEVSAATMRANRLVSGLPGHELQDAYKMLRTRVLQSLRAKGWNSVAITGPASGCGKTLTAINLAISLSMEVSNTVLLVDLDFRKPSIHTYFDYEPQYGISDYLLSDVPLSDILFSPSIDRLVVLPGREAILNSSEMLGSPKMVALTSELKNRYPERLIIFDLPPILQADDALSFAPYTDCMLLVAENGGTHRADLAKALELLKATPIIGTVFNKSEPVRGGYYQRSPEKSRRWWRFGA